MKPRSQVNRVGRTEKASIAMRRVTLLALLLVPPQLGGANEAAARAAKLQIDHVIVGTADLDRGIDQFQQLTGVRPALGGDHPGRGTRNALAALGDGRYLEILAPQSEASASGDVDDLRKLRTLTPIGWAVSTSDPEATVRFIKQAGYAVSDPKPGSRVKPDGTKLEWVTFGLTSSELSEAPFFISWNPKSAHPSTDSPSGCRLAGVTLMMTNHEQARRLLELLALGVEMKRGGSTRLEITLRCPKGPVRFGAE